MPAILVVVLIQPVAAPHPDARGIVLPVAAPVDPRRPFVSRIQRRRLGGTGVQSGACDRPNPGSLTFCGPSVYPEYLTDVRVLVCPSDPNGLSSLEAGAFNEAGLPGGPVDPCRIEALSYLYLGWALKEEWLLKPAAGWGLSGLSRAESFLPEVVDALASPFEAAAPTADEQVRRFDSDLPVGAQTIYRLREGVERFFISDVNDPEADNSAQTDIPVMLDRFGVAGGRLVINHVPGGCNVLYMDGHVEFVRYAGKFPVSAEFEWLVKNVWSE